MSAAPDIVLASEFAEVLAMHLGANVRRISLFGSRARRDQNRHSDFDLMIVLDSPTGALRSLIHSLALQWELERRVDLSTKILSFADFSTGIESIHTFWKNYRKDERILWTMT